MERSAQGVMGAVGASVASCQTTGGGSGGRRPNILFAIADDWSWPHASAYGTPEVHTPAFDRVASEGCLFNNAFTAAPQCSPNRAAMLTGRNIWQIEEAGTHGSVFPNKYESFVDHLESGGYHVGVTGKGWRPGSWERGGWTRNPAGPEYNERIDDNVPAKGFRNLDYAANFDDFLADREEEEPFFFWYGCNEPHRFYEAGTGLKAGKNPDKVDVPSFLPNTQVVREDFLDYFVEVEWFDTHLGRMLAKLEALGELDNTIVVVSSDNGMPFPRAKANVYEYGTHVPLAVRWPGHIEAGRNLDTLVSFIDLAPTFLDVAGLPTPEAMTGQSFLPTLTDDKPSSYRERDFVLTGRERHTHARFDNLGYPCRTIRTDEYLYIRNVAPDRYPSGDPDGYYDIDACPTKTHMIERRDSDPDLFAATFEKRPAEELFDIRTDADCMRNLIGDAAYSDVHGQLSARLTELLTEQGDPRALGYGDIFESYPRVSGTRPWLGGFAERGMYNPKYFPRVPGHE
jgi:uncharacterized sulfatase